MPILYGTTDAFLRHFCLTSLADLPEIDFSALADRIAEAEAKQAAENRRPIRWTSWRRTSPAKRRRNKNCAAGCRLIHRGEAVAAQARSSINKRGERRS